MRWINPITDEEVVPANLKTHEKRVFSEQVKAHLGLKPAPAKRAA